MNIVNVSLASMLCGITLLQTTAMPGDNTVYFPAVSDYRAMTSGPKEHLFASYFLN